MVGWVEGIRRALVLDLMLIAGTAIKLAPSVGPRQIGVNSSMSPSLFNYYIADMLRPTPLVKRVCYADYSTVWDSGPNIPQLESMINSYLRDVGIYLNENSLLICVPKSTVMLFTADKHQFQTHPDITLEDTQLPLERSPKILGVIMDPSLSFHKHCTYVSDRINK